MDNNDNFWTTTIQFCTFYCPGHLPRLHFYSLLSNHLSSFQITFFCNNDTLDCEQNNGRAAIRGGSKHTWSNGHNRGEGGGLAALKIPINIYFCDHVSVCLIPFLRFLSVPIFDISCAMLIFWYKGSRKKTGIYSQVDRKGRGGSPLPA